MVLDVKSKGKLVPYLNSGGSFGDAVTFADIGVLLAELAQNNDAYKHKIFPVKYLKWKQLLFVFQFFDKSFQTMKFLVTII